MSLFYLFWLFVCLWALFVCIYWQWQKNEIFGIKVCSHPYFIHPTFLHSSIHPSIHPYFIHPTFLHSSIHPSIHPSIHTSFILPSFIHPSLHIFIHPSLLHSSYLHSSIHSSILDICNILQIWCLLYHQRLDALQIIWYVEND